LPIVPFLLALAPSLFGGVGCAPPTSPAASPVRAPAPEGAERAIVALLDGWHDAAARADENAYFSALASDAVFMGTDATERWSKDAFRAYAHPHFAKGKAWAFRATRRTVRLSSSGEVAWFDEDLETANLGPARGSGVVVFRDGAYKIAHYNLSIPIPNARFSSVNRLLSGDPLAPPARSTEPYSPASFTSPARAQKVSALLPKVSALVGAAHASRHLPSLAVALVVDGRVVLTSVHGFADVGTKRRAHADTVYRIGSITKTFTAEALLALRDEGKLSLDDRLDAHLPEARGLRHAPGDARAVTLRELLSHVSGLPRLGGFDYTRPDRDVTEAEVLASLGTTVAEAPDTAYLYSNFGMGLVGLVVGRAAKAPYRDVVRDKLLVPLGMSSTAFDEKAFAPELVASGYASRFSNEPAPRWRLGASEGAGGIYASLTDMAKWVAFQLDAWPPRDGGAEGPLARASRREAHVPRFFTGLTADAKGSPKGTLDASATGVGLAWHTRTTCAYERLVEHGGAIDGFSSQVVFAPDRGFGLVVLTNALDGGAAAIGDEVLELLASEPALAPRQPVANAELSALVGRFVGKMPSFDEESYVSLFAESFRNAVPLAKMQEVGLAMTKAHGACTVGPATEVRGAASATFRLSCARGSILAHASLQSGKLAGLVVESTGLPATAATTTAARDALSFLSRWDHPRYAKVFAGTAKEDVLEKAFARQRDSVGVCKLAGPGEGDGARRATFALTCDKARGKPWEMSVGLDDAGKVREVFFRPKERAGRCF
jgi:CubicO group peptidase (beta-lactamase class C family)/ketosteroid isomerase-like protein